MKDVAEKNYKEARLPRKPIQKGREWACRAVTEVCRAVGGYDRKDTGRSEGYVEMSTCKDCYHYEACADMCRGINDEYFKKYSQIDFDYKHDCDFFKDKSKIIELPCNKITNEILQDVLGTVIRNAWYALRKYNWLPKLCQKYGFDVHWNMTDSEALRALSEADTEQKGVGDEQI